MQVLPRHTTYTAYNAVRSKTLRSQARAAVNPWLDWFSFYQTQLCSNLCSDHSVLHRTLKITVLQVLIKLHHLQLHEGGTKLFHLSIISLTWMSLPVPWLSENQFTSTSRSLMNTHHRFSVMSNVNYIMGVQTPGISASLCNAVCLASQTISHKGRKKNPESLKKDSLHPLDPQKALKKI